MKQYIPTVNETIPVSLQNIAEFRSCHSNIQFAKTGAMVQEEGTVSSEKLLQEEGRGSDLSTGVIRRWAVLFLVRIIRGTRDAGQIDGLLTTLESVS